MEPLSLQDSGKGISPENLQKIGKKGFTGQKFVLKKRHFMSLFTNGLVC
jgi:hypothetical protein